MKVAVVGLGSIGMRHAQNIRSLGHDVVGFDPVPRVASPDLARAPSLPEAISMADAVVIASPTSMHEEHATCALEQGRPVLVEKPLAADPRGAERVASLAAAHGLMCGVAMNLRFHPAVRALRRLIGEGALGEVRYAQVSSGSDLRKWRPGTDYRTSYSARAELGGGVVRDSIHELDYLTWLLGPPASVTAEAGRVSDLEIDVEDVALALIRLASGALASVDLTYVDPVYRRGCLVVGALASARWDWGRGTVEVARPAEALETIDVSADVAETYMAEIRDFIEAVQSGGAVSTTAEEGSAVVRLADAVLRSAREGRRVIL